MEAPVMEHVVYWAESLCVLQGVLCLLMTHQQPRPLWKNSPNNNHKSPTPVWVDVKTGLSGILEHLCNILSQVKLLLRLSYYLVWNSKNNMRKIFYENILYTIIDLYHKQTHITIFDKARSISIIKH